MSLPIHKWQLRMQKKAIVQKIRICSGISNCNQLLPLKILTRKAFENAISVIMAVGGSTNAVLHMLAIAHAAGVELSLDDFEIIRAVSQSYAISNPVVGM